MEPAVAVRIAKGALLAASAASLLAATGAQASETVTERFTATGAEQTFVVPAGIATISVRAVGGTGKGGGAPAEVTGSVGVSPGETLYVEVGGSPTGQAGGFNGGGNGGNEAAGGGGGASDVRTVTRANPETTLASRLIVAGAGGGASSTGNGGGAAGAEGLPLEEGGKPGTQTAGGLSEEEWECWIEKEHEGKHEGGTPGELGTGGEGEGCRSRSHGSAGGGGGGAGLYGGGGGGVEFDVEPPYEFASGGGGGSSLLPEGGTSALAAGGAAVVELAYVPRKPLPLVTSEPASGVGVNGATLNATVNPQGSTVTSCNFEYGTSVFYESTSPCSASPGSGNGLVEVSAALEGLSETTTYHYRIVATNAEGTSAGEDAEFTTAAHEAPRISGFTPHEGTAGTTIAFTGTELDHVSSVTFAAAEGTELTHLSPTSLRVRAPASAPGQATVVLHDDLGEEVTAGTFEYVSAPAIAKVAPKKGSTAGGTTVVITGSALDAVTEVLFGSVPGTISSKAPGTLSVTAPPNSAGRHSVTVVSAGGASAPSTRAVFTAKGVTVTSVSPSAGPAGGGTPVTVAGSGFAPGPGTTTFLFGKVAASAVECSSTAECTMLAPAAAKQGAVNVRAVVGSAKSKKGAAGLFTYE